MPTKNLFELATYLWQAVLGLIWGRLEKRTHFPTQRIVSPVFFFRNLALPCMCFADGSI